MPRKKTKLPIFIRHAKMQPRLFIAAAIAVVIGFLTPEDWRISTRMLFGWNVAVAAYLAMVAWMMFYSDIKHIQQRAEKEDEGRIALLILTALVAVASLGAIVAELAIVPSLPEDEKPWHVALTGVTVFLSWTFLQTIFALHYAHEYYSDEDGHPSGGLNFPCPKKSDEQPDYWDFVYYSFILGTSVQTADVDITSRLMRRTATIHCVLGFFFNTFVLALAINIAAGLLK